MGYSIKKLVHPPDSLSTIALLIVRAPESLSTVTLSHTGTKTHNGCTAKRQSSRPAAPARSTDDPYTAQKTETDSRAPRLIRASDARLPASHVSPGHRPRPAPRLRLGGRPHLRPNQAPPAAAATPGFSRQLPRAAGTVDGATLAFSLRRLALALCGTCRGLFV